MLWVKAFHIIFVVSWYAGLLYLPRLFVYHADCHDEVGDERFKVMERKLFAITTIGLVGSAVFGFWLLGSLRLGRLVDQLVASDQARIDRRVVRLTFGWAS